MTASLVRFTCMFFLFEKGEVLYSFILPLAALLYLNFVLFLVLLHFACVCLWLSFWKF